MSVRGGPGRRGGRALPGGTARAGRALPALTALVVVGMATVLATPAVPPAPAAANGLADTATPGSSTTSDVPQVKLIAPDGRAGDRFARSVALSGDTAVAGAPLAPIDGNIFQGAAYAFTRDGDEWAGPQKLVASDGGRGDLLGTATAADGDTLLIGARGGSRAYIFVRGSDGVWTEQARLDPDGDAVGANFGEWLALDGDTAVVGAPNVTDEVIDQGAAYVFTRDTAGEWHLDARLQAPDPERNDQFGRALAVAGDTLLVGAPFANGDGGNLQGKVYAYQRDGGGTWQGPEILTASDPEPLDRFGFSTALDASGETAVVGALGDEAGEVDTTGTAYVLTRDGDGGWTEQVKLAASDGAEFDNFGHTVAVADDGDRAVIAADFATVGENTFQGAAYVFARDGDGGWSEEFKLTADDGEEFDGFGNNAVAIDGNTAFIGAASSARDGEMFFGAGYVFSLPPDEEPAPPACDETVTGLHAGPLTVTGGVTCLAAGAFVLGEVNVLAGATLRGSGAVVQGPVSALGAAALDLSFSQVTGPVLVSGATGTVRLLGSQLTGSVSLLGNTTTEPAVVAGNTIIGTLSCFDNQPLPTDQDWPNTATGGIVGDCSGPPPVEITTGSLPTLHVLEEYQATLTAAGGTPPYTWSAENLPAGLILDPATGVVTNDPAAPAIRGLPEGQVTVTVTDDGGASDQVALPLEAVVVEQIAAGNDHTCAVTSDTAVYCWGGNISGQLGDGTTEDRPLPAPVVDPDDPTTRFTGAVEITAREAHTCVTTVDGGAYCWGFNGAGRLGLGHDRSEVIPVPGQVVAPEGADGHLTDVVGIGAGALHTCAVTGGGTVACWGDNFRGQLGRSGFGGGVPGLVRDPAQPDQPLTGLAAVGLGGFHTCVVTVDTTGYCAGWNHVGQLGTGSVVPLQSSRLLAVSDPDAPGQPLTGLDHVDGGGVHTCAGTVDGTAYCWGQNAAGQLGNGDAPANNAVPQQVRDPEAPDQALAGLDRVGTGVLHSCATTVDTGAYCWGSNDGGQLGDATTEDSDLPVTVTDPGSGFAFIQVASLAHHGWHTCAAMVGGSAYCWGNNGSGQLGDATTEDRALPTPVRPGPAGA